MKPPRQRAAIIANRVRMKREHYPDEVFLLVEGDDDEKLYGRFVDAARCRIQTAYGRPSVEAALKMLEVTDDRVIGVVDTDMDGLEQRALDRDNLFRTDTHDAETMMLASPALDHLVREHADEQAVEELEQTGTSVRERLLELARLFGALRWISARKGLRLRFEEFPFERVIDKKTWRLERKRILPALQNHSQAGVLDTEAILADVAVILEADDIDPWHLCCGHDMIAILSIGLQRVLGTRNPADVKPKKVLEKDLRLAYETAYFANTRLCSALREWERGHVAFLCAELQAAGNDSPVAG